MTLLNFNDLTLRIWKAGFKLQRVPFEIGRYEALDHEEDVGNPKNQDRWGRYYYNKVLRFIHSAFPQPGQLIDKRQRL